jgi:hypothetical protein
MVAATMIPMLNVVVVVVTCSTASRVMRAMATASCGLTNTSVIRKAMYPAHSLIFIVPSGIGDGGSIAPPVGIGGNGGDNCCCGGR